MSEHTSPAGRAGGKSAPARIVTVVAAICIATIDAFCGRTSEAKENLPPIASLQVYVDDNVVPNRVTIDASGSSDPDGDPVDVSICVDGQRLAGGAPIRTIEPRKRGKVLISLRVSDGRSASTEEEVVLLR